MSECLRCGGEGERVEGTGEGWELWLCWHCDTAWSYKDGELYAVGRLNFNNKDIRPAGCLGVFRESEV